MHEHAVPGATHASSTNADEAAAPTQAKHVAAPAVEHAASVQRAIEPRPDHHDHSTPPALGGAVGVQLRTLLAHVDHNLQLAAIASTQPDRDAALDAIDTRVGVALNHVPEAQHGQFRASLHDELGANFHSLHDMIAAGQGEHGARVASWLGIPRTPATGSVQLDTGSAQIADADVQRTAAAGVAGGGGSLPHVERIQAAFGRHDVRGVAAHVGGHAADAATTIGASAYAMGNSVAFASAPDLRLAAHEAAHVVQQRTGVGAAVGRAGDAYEQHADEVADLVVRGESAERVLDRMSGGGGSTTAVQRQTTERVATGHYAALNATAQLGQAASTVVGRIELHDGTAMHSFRISTERAWTNAGSDGFRGTATSDDGNAGVVLILAGDQLRVQLGAEIITMHRTSTQPVMSPPVLSAAGVADAQVGAAPLTVVQNGLVDNIVTIARTRLADSMSTTLGLAASGHARSAALSAIDRAVEQLFTVVGADQRAEATAITRDRLAHSPLVIDGITWSVLDWLYMAMRRIGLDIAPSVQHITQRLLIPTGNTSDVDGSTVHRYRLTLREIGLDVEAIEGAGAHVGLLEVQELAPDGRQLWSHTYGIGRANLDEGLRESGEVGIHGAGVIVETAFPWDAIEFGGPIGGFGGTAGASGDVLGEQHGPEFSRSTLMIYGQRHFPALEVHFGGDEMLGASGGVGAAGSGEAGYLLGAPLEATRDPAATTASPEARTAHAMMRIEMAFDTDEFTLNASGQRALREVLAWHEELLGTGHAVTVNAYTSRSGSDEHNLELSQRRRQEVMLAIAGAMPQAHLEFGEARGEAAAREAGVPDGDNAQRWRRADVLIDGVVVLELYAPIGDSTGITAELSATR